MRLALAALLLLAPPALAVERANPSARLGVARAAIEAGDHAGAMAQLRGILAAEPGNADALNLLGYASRRAGALEEAMGHYEAALAADPEHLGALEYQGELFLMIGDEARAQANLARLAALCGACEEHADLAEAIAGGAGG